VLIVNGKAEGHGYMATK